VVDALCQSQLDDAATHRNGHRLGPVAGAQLFHDVLDVHLDGFLGDQQPLADVPVATSARHVLEDADPTFASRVKPGDFVVGGSNFGLGSSREHAPTIIKLAGVSAVLAKSFARIFFRNAINVGLPVLVCDTDQINDGDELEVYLPGGVVRDLTNGKTLTFGKIPPQMIAILESGGLAEYIKKYGDFQLAE